jgi:hypothetical protein
MNNINIVYININKFQFLFNTIYLKNYKEINRILEIITKLHTMDY